ncbi:hypothetical protein F5B20DRAFT_518280 [Whalleya microplaca]|nr:hypothetical protein F5B20DRAFT_518280 [Whalleya microplaca]
MGRETQKIFARINDYLKAYDPVLSLVKTLDPHAKQACQGLSLMILILSNKKTKEDILDKVIDKLGRHTSELDISHDIHRDDVELKDLVTKTYLHLYNFSIEACYYYIGPRWKRILKTVTEPPEVNVKKKADDLNEAVLNVRERCLILTQRLIAQMALELEDVKQIAKQNRNFAEDATKRADRKDLAILEPQLRHGSQAEENLKSYRDDLSRTVEQVFNNCSPLDVSDLRSTAAFKEWETNGRSSLLLVTGQTEDHDEMHCWLSPGLFAIHDHCKKREDIVLLFCCRPGPGGSSKPIQVVDLLKDLAYQVLVTKPRLLREESVKKVLPGLAGETRNTNARPSRPYDILLSLLKGRGRVWIFIDRIDNCVSGHIDLISNLAELMRGLGKGDKQDILKVFLLAASDIKTEFKLIGKGKNTRRDIQYILGDHDCQFIDQDHSAYNIGFFPEIEQNWMVDGEK